MNDIFHVAIKILVLSILINQNYLFNCKLNLIFIKDKIIFFLF